MAAAAKLFLLLSMIVAIHTEDDNLQQIQLYKWRNAVPNYPDGDYYMDRRSNNLLRKAFYNSPLTRGGKRGIDFGLGRGFSGSEAAKHRMGMAAASFAGGPGRRRR